MIANEIEPRRWNQGGKLPYQIQRLKYHMRCAIAPSMPELIDHPAIWKLREALHRYRRACNIPAKHLQLMPRFCGNGYICMQAEAGEICTTPHSLFAFKFFFKTDCCDALARP